MKKIFIVLVLLFSNLSVTQENEIANAQQNAILSMSLVDALANRIPGARKIIDRMGNHNIAIRGRQSLKTAGDEVLWEIDGVIYNYPPSLTVSQVDYVELLNGLASTNKYGSEGAAGVIVVKTNVSAEKFNSRKNLLNKSSKFSKKVKKRDKKIKKP